MGYKIVWTRRAEKDAERLDRTARERVIAAIERFAGTGHGAVAKLTGVKPAEYRLRAGDWRVRFTREGATLTVLRVANRRDAYR